MEQWKTGDIITAERLNGMTSPMIVGQHATIEGALNKTWKEMYDAFVLGIPVVYQEIVDDEHMHLTMFGTLSYIGSFVYKGDPPSGHWDVEFMFQSGGNLKYTTDTENGYPISN